MSLIYISKYLSNPLLNEMISQMLGWVWRKFFYRKEIKCHLDKRTLKSVSSQCQPGQCFTGKYSSYFGVSVLPMDTNSHITPWCVSLCSNNTEATFLIAKYSLCEPFNYRVIVICSHLLAPSLHVGSFKNFLIRDHGSELLWQLWL